MKSIIISGKEFQYQDYYQEPCGYAPGSGGWRTNFYYGTEKKKSDSWFWNGETERPMFAFTIMESIESTAYSKEELKNKLEKEVAAYFKMIERKNEIKKGELIS